MEDINIVKRYVTYFNNKAADTTIKTAIATLLIRNISTSSFNEGAIKFFAKELVKKCEEDNTFLNISEDFAVDANGKKYRSLLMDKNKCLLAYAYDSSDSYEEVFNFSKKRYAELTDTLERRLMLVVNDGNYVLGKHGVYKNDSQDNENIYKYYECDNEGEVIRESFVNKNEGIMVVTDNIKDEVVSYKFTANKDFKISEDDTTLDKKAMIEKLYNPVRVDIENTYDSMEDIVVSKKTK